MEGFGIIFLIVIAIIIYNSAYASGKREGSRKGYGVGFDRGRRSKSKSGCVVILMIVAGITTAASVAFAYLQ